MKLLSISLIAAAVLAFLPGCASSEYSGQTPLQQAMHHSSYDAAAQNQYPY
jgi:hypothetical protein